MSPDPSSLAESIGHSPEPQALLRAADERRLVAAVLHRDRKAAAEFVSRYVDAVYGYVSRRLAPRADLVDDIVQDVFLVALEKLETFTGQAPVSAWLIGIARHKVEDFYRALLREPEPFGDDLAEASPSDDPHPDEVIDAVRVQEKTRRILEQLPAAYSAALLWRYWEKRSAKEMASETARTEKAIERLLARARASFRRLWEANS
jgi:RNA polymerase sigma-70 factor (ECF subfamily)